MSYDRRGRYGGGGGGGGDRRRDERRMPPETEEQKLRNSILRLGDNQSFQPAADLKNVGDNLRTALPAYLPAIADAFRISISEQPFKTPYTTALFQIVTQPSPSTNDEKSPTELGAKSSSPAQSLFQELCKGFQSYLDHLAWRDLRLTVHFFAYLTLSKTVSVSSFLELLQSFLVVLDEPGVSWERMEAAALCAGDGLLRAGLPLYEYDPSAVEAIISTIRSCLTTAKLQSLLTRPITSLHSNDTTGATELLDTLVKVLDAQLETSFKEFPECLPQPYLLFSPQTSEAETEAPALFEIPSSMVPPEDFDFGSSSDDFSTNRRVMMPRISLRFFDAEISPPPSSLNGFIIRSCIVDTINIFEVNRRECARIVLELPKWFTWGTFKGKRGLGPEPDNLVDLEYMLEITLLEVALSELAILPFSSQPAVYYAALISELCKVSPETVGPAVGKSIRKFYSLIGEGLDVEVTRRLTEWFAVHMSNFSFNWVWKEWIPDLDRSKYHPKRLFIARAVELEVRLAYHERIMKTLPEPFLDPEVDLVAEAAPGPEFEFESPQHPYYEPTQALLNLIRTRAQVDDVIPVAEGLRSTISENVSLSPDVTPDSAVRTITMQILLHVGSRSISHFLNAIERYLPLLRTLGSTPENKLDYLHASAKFWRRNGQMISIVFDKLMQYQIVDPSDIIAWSFRGVRGDKTSAYISVQAWDLLKAALDKAIGRVAIAHQKVQTLRKDDEDAKAKAMAGTSASDENENEMDVDSEDAKKAKHFNARVAEVSEALSNAEKGLSVLAREQRMALAKALEGFVAALVEKSSPETLAILTSDGWDARDDWTREQWEQWETWGWFRNFCRFYATQLRSNQVTFEAGPVSGLATAEEGSPRKLVWDIWSVAVGRNNS